MCTMNTECHAEDVVWARLFRGCGITAAPGALEEGTRLLGGVHERRGQGRVTEMSTEVWA